MHQPFNKYKLRIQAVNKPALIRLTIFLVILLSFCLYLWLTMLRMPAQSYRGNLPLLQPAEITLQNLLKQDLQTISVDIGERNYSQYQKLDMTRTFLENALTKLGYTVQKQKYEINNKSDYNLEVEKNRDRETQ